jgi:hypothetical protein
MHSVFANVYLKNVCLREKNIKKYNSLNFKKLKCTIFNTHISLFNSLTCAQRIHILKTLNLPRYNL